MVDPGEGPGWPPPPPALFLDQNEPRRAEKIFFEARPPPYLMVWMTPSPPLPLLSEGLDSPVYFAFVKLINICVLVWVGTWRPTVVFLARLLLASSRNHGEDYGNEKITKCNRLNKQHKNSKLAAGLFDRFLYRHHTTNVVKRHRSGNSAILAFISKIVV